MSKKLYVGNLSFTTTEEELQTLFSQFGEVKSVAIIKDRDTGRSRGFGFVEMENAEAGISGTNGKEFGGRTLTVNEAREREERGRGGSSRGGFGDRQRSW